MGNPDVQTRGHNFKIFKQQARLDIRKYFFSARVVDEWNSLTSETGNASSLNNFKIKF